MKCISLPWASVVPKICVVGVVALTGCPLAGAQTNESMKLLPADGVGSDWFGWAVAIDGQIAVVGASGDDDNGSSSGSAYVFDVTTGQQLAKLLPDDGASGEFFGWAVAIDGQIAVVGASGDDDNGASSGSAYVFDVTTGQQLAKLLPDDGTSGEFFGESVAISGTTAVVGAIGDDDNGSFSGSAYVFDVTTGQQLVKLLPSDGAASDHFGRSVAIDGTTVVVGAHLDDDNGTNSGSAYVFDVTNGQELVKLLPMDGASDDRFGYSVAVDGTEVLVGAISYLTGPGSAYLFYVTIGNVQQIAKLQPSDGEVFDLFGHSVAIDGKFAVVGAVGDGDSSGSAYVFGVMTGTEVAKLQPSDGAISDHFGYSVAIDGAEVLVGAMLGDDSGSDSGSAYVFDADCNGNGIPDWDDIASGTSTDCDGNGRPDECQLVDPTTDWNGDGILDVCVSPNYCDAAVNSTGIPGVIGTSGTPVASENSFTLKAWDLPTGQFAYFLTSESTAFIPGFGGSSGNLCLGAPQYRFNIPAGGGKILNSGSTGTVSHTLDLNLLPQGITFDPGETWYFQLWYRDTIASGPTSNTTDGFEVMFR